jgi:MYXO-CTERM domain-containing protein
MNHPKIRSLIIVLFALLCTLRIQATPLTLNYTVTPQGGGLYDYDFTLTLDNHDGSFAAGQGWSWITFGDVFSGPTNLSNFVFDAGDFPIGSFTQGDFSSGGHNGPTLLIGSSGITYWTPTTVGSFLQWSGTSTANLGQGALAFSTLITTGGASAANFEIARLGPVTSSVPEAGSVGAMLALGLAALAFSRRR